MSCHVVWKNSMGDAAPHVNNARLVPKKPTIWYGEIYLVVPDDDGNLVKDSRTWKTPNKVLKEDAMFIVDELRKRLIGEHGKDNAVDSGFWMRSR